MRNFSSVTTVPFTFTTFNCNQEYYGGNPSELIEEVLEALAKAFETNVRLVKRTYIAAVKFKLDPVAFNISLLDDEMNLITPSEHRVIDDLIEFFDLARKCYDDYFNSDSGSMVFSYHNLNTGKSVIWTATCC